MVNRAARVVTIAKSILSLDVGEKRVGVAIASRQARLPRPLITLDNDSSFFEALQKIIDDEAVDLLVVGLPRGLDGQRTAQTKLIEDFVRELRKRVSVPIHVQDEAVTSQHAEAELEARGQPYSKADIDALAATYILDDWLAENKEQAV